MAPEAVAPGGTILRLNDVTAGYGRSVVLREVSLSMDAGEILAIVGPNGSGKSSLLKVALGSLRPSAGSVMWFDQALAGWARRELAKRVAYLPQGPSSLPGERVSDVVASGRSPYWGPFGVESPRDRQATAEAAELLGLGEWMNRDIATLSGGQRQRVFIARCVAQTLGGPAAQRPGAILLDEPDTYLDLRHIAELSGILRVLARRRRMGILLASHDLNLAAGVADRMVLLGEGEIVAAGTPGEVMRPDVVETAYGVKVSTFEAAGRRFLVPAS